MKDGQAIQEAALDSLKKLRSSTDSVTGAITVLCACEGKRAVAKRKLADKQVELLAGGAVTGANEKERSAKLELLTRGERGELEAQDGAVALARAEYERREHEVKAAREEVRLMAALLNAAAD